MKIHASAPRIIAVVVRARRYGYAVFEGPKRLLDWGGGEIVSHETGNLVGVKRLAFLFKHFSPATAVLRRSPRRRENHHPRADAFIDFAKEHASQRQVPVIFLDVGSVERSFQIFGARTKHETASALTAIFPEFLWKLPPERKSWKNEAHMMIVFDAIATGFAYWQENGCRVHASTDRNSTPAG